MSPFTHLVCSLVQVYRMKTLTGYGLLPKALLDSELDAILSAYGYEAYFNPELILSGAIPVASHLLALQWEFLHSTDPAFILTDRPVPIQIGDGFRIVTGAKGRAVRRQRAGG